MRFLCFAGDTFVFELTESTRRPGRAMLRTNIGQAHTVKRETIRHVEKDEHPLGRCWYDIAMVHQGNGNYRLTLALTEVGHFEAKAYFLPDDAKDPQWPDGPNVSLNVAPADTCCANIVYNAFVRQFGPNKTRYQGVPDESLRELDHRGYTVIPPSGKFRDLIHELDFIIGTLGCRVIQLLPIHPTPTTYARMGRFGSPYAALSFTEVDPALARFDPKATPLEQFIELVDAVHARHAKLFIDIAINHTGWAASLHETHPQWLARTPGGKIEMPGAWGVIWADLTRLDYSHQDLWQYMADIFLTWCNRGVDGFRCDAGYMIPTPAWEYIIAVVREQFPDVVFFLEGLGGKISVTRELLNRAGFNWAYSELFQNYDRPQIEHYLPETMDISTADGLTLHFAETHDNPRLAATSTTYARMRTALCALLSHNGAFGFANGVEWYAAEKINVHQSVPLNWGADENQVEWIRRLTHLLKFHPAFHHPVRMSLVNKSTGNTIAALREHVLSGRKLLVVVNPDTRSPGMAAWPGSVLTAGQSAYLDLLTGTSVDADVDGDNHLLTMAPGEVRCLSQSGEDKDVMGDSPASAKALPPHLLHQRLRAKALEILSYYRGVNDLGDMDPDQAAVAFKASPLDFCRSMNPHSRAARVVVWQYPEDSRREVMIPPGHFLLIRTAGAARALIVKNKKVVSAEESLDDNKGRSFILCRPLKTPQKHTRCQLRLSVFAPDGTAHVSAALLFLSAHQHVRIKSMFSRPKKQLGNLLVLATNQRGAMLRAHAHWGKLVSRYDALLAANLNPDYPEDRRIVLTRIRGWLVYQGHSQALGSDTLDAFGIDEKGCGYWRFSLPTGQGQHVAITINASMAPAENRIGLTLFRHPAGRRKQRLPDDRPVIIILRPDVEDRNFHDTTKAYAGPEHQWPAAVKIESRGFAFNPADSRTLAVQVDRGLFVSEPEWQYMVYRQLEAERGLDSDSDLFSPGFFRVQLQGNEQMNLAARVTDGHPGTTDATTIGEDRDIGSFFQRAHSSIPVDTAFKRALEHYIVKRKDYSTVIAGYPWFLDWGRDTLIVVRGIIAAGWYDIAGQIIRQFAGFEENGTLPNMIRGENTGNRDTSDAPLWLFRVCEELCDSAYGPRILDMNAGGRTVREILISLAGSFINGTPNGILMDAGSGLLYSPAHFTWMDTNFPAGTPRQGYPIEIQALWFAALDFLSRIDGEKGVWQDLARQVRQSILLLFVQPDMGYLSDCLHAEPGGSAKNAVPDNALRPNQLFALTLNAVTDPELTETILRSSSSLMVPGALRSLADRQLSPPLSIFHSGQLVNDPNRPYIGIYAGDEDTRRKPAYHNGTAWTWLFPSYCEAWVKCYGVEEKATALSLLGSCSRLMNDGCVGHMPEITDGDRPHLQRGCDAQAWGASEFLRVWLTLTR
ncbi:MAG: glycogen debranching protein [Desulfobacteraceae bacterium]|nr:glycogen debranching protein [Desulfobacteraceae bacterium]